MTAPEATHPAPVAPAAGPPFGAAFAATYRVVLRCIATPGKLAGMGALVAIGFLSAVIISAAGPDDPAEAASTFLAANISTILPVAVLVFGAASLGDAMDDGSMVYLWLRPVPSAAHVLGAWAATATVVAPLVVAPILLSTAVLEFDGQLIVAGLAASVVAIAAYGPLFVLIGIRFRRSLSWGLAYILLWEGFVAAAGDTAARLSVRAYTTSIIEEIAEVDLEAQFNLASGMVVPLTVGAAALWLASRVLDRAEIP